MMQTELGINASYGSDIIKLLLPWYTKWLDIVWFYFYT